MQVCLMVYDTQARFERNNKSFCLVVVCSTKIILRDYHLAGQLETGVVTFVNKFFINLINAQLVGAGVVNDFHF